MTGPLRQHLTDSLAETADRFGAFLKRHGLNFERFAAHLRLDILTPREAWAVRRFAAISGSGGANTAVTDLKNALFTPALQTIAPITASGTLTGTAVDMIDCDGPCFGLLVVGAVSAGTTAATVDVKYTEADTAAGTYSDVPRATHAQVTASSKCSRVNFKRSKRFIKAVATMSGTSPTAAIAVVVEGQLKTRN